MHDKQIRAFGIRLVVQTPDLALLSDVALPRAVACLARDAQFRHLRMPRLRRAIVVGLRGGRMTSSAHVIPGLRPVLQRWGADKGRVPWYPPLLGNEPGKRETNLTVAQAN